jgi:hypothetical protein
MGVGVMKDETLKRRDLNVSHTLGCKTYSTTVSQVVVKMETGGLVRLATNRPTIALFYIL